MDEESNSKWGKKETEIFLIACCICFVIVAAILSFYYISEYNDLVDKYNGCVESSNWELFGLSSDLVSSPILDVVEKQRVVYGSVVLLGV